MKTLVIIPAYNEEENISLILQQIAEQKEIKPDILVVNDYSTDQTSKICKKTGVKVIDLACNLGIGGAVQTGYKYAFRHKYDFAVQIDGDGQHDAKYLADLIKPLEENNADIVIGSRFIAKEGFQSTIMRRLGIKFFSDLIKLLTGQKITDPTSGFRACNSKVIELFAQKYPKDYPEPESIVFLKRNNFKILEIPVVMKERLGGKSSIIHLKPAYYMIKVTLAMIIENLRK